MPRSRRSSSLSRCARIVRSIRSASICVPAHRRALRPAGAPSRSPGTSSSSRGSSPPTTSSSHHPRYVGSPVSASRSLPAATVFFLRDGAPTLPSHVQRQLRLGRRPVRHALEAEEGLVARRLHRRARHLDPLHQLPLVRLHRVQREHRVVLVGVRRRVPQRRHRPQLLQRLPPLPLQPTVHALRLVHHHHRPAPRDHVHRLRPAQGFVRLVEVVALSPVAIASLPPVAAHLVDRLHRHHHHLRGQRRRETPHLLPGASRRTPSPPAAPPRIARGSAPA